MTAILQITERYGSRPFQTGNQQWQKLARSLHLAPTPLIKEGGLLFSHETGRTQKLQESPALRQPDRGQACLHGRGLGMRHLWQAQSHARQGWIPCGCYFVPPFTRPGCQIQRRSSSVHAARAESLNLRNLFPNWFTPQSGRELAQEVSCRSRSWCPDSFRHFAKTVTEYLARIDG